MKNSFKEYKNIPKFKLNSQKLDDVIDELIDYIYELDCINYQNLIIIYYIFI